MRSSAAIFSFCATLVSGAAAAAGQSQCLDAVFSALRPTQFVTADVAVSKTVPALAQPLVSRGRVTVTPAGGLIWRTVFPFEQTTVFGKRQTGRTDESGNLVVTESPAASRILQVFSRDAAAQRARFEEQFFLSCSQKGATATLIATPRHESVKNYLTEVSVTVDRVLRRALITQPDGTISRIAFSAHRFSDEPAVEDLALLERVQ